MANRDLIAYIKTSFEKGRSADETREELLKAGWHASDVDAALEAVGAGAISRVAVGDDLKTELRAIKEALEVQNRRIAALEGRGAAEPLFKAERMPASAPAAPSAATAARPMPRAKEEESMETKVTGRWFPVVGVVALLFGVSFFLKYAFERDLISETGRIILGILSGIVLLALGYFLSRKEKYRQYSFFLSGGGLALLYLSIYGAFSYYHLIGQAPAFLFMILVTAAGAALSLKQDSKILSGLALFGGFLTPYLVSTGVDNQPVLMSYVALLNIGFLAISYFRQWRELFLVNFLGTYVVFYGWMAKFYDRDKLGPTLVFLTIYFLIFFIAPYLRSYFRKGSTVDKDVILNVLNAALYFATSYYLLERDFDSYRGPFFALGGLVYLLASYLLLAVNREDRYGVLGLGGTGLILLSLAIPIQFEKQWITIAWAFEALFLTWIGFTLKNRYLRTFGGLVFVVTAARLLLFDSSLRAPITEFTLILNDRFMAFAIAVAAMFIAALMYRTNDKALEENERSVPAALGVAANFFLVLILTLEANAFFNQKIAEANQGRVSAPQYYGEESGYFPGRTEVPELRALRNAKNLTVSLIWTLYAAILMTVGIMKRFRSARLLSMALFGLVVLKVFVYDIRELADIYRIVAFIVLGVILLVVSFLFYRYKAEIKKFLAA